MNCNKVGHELALSVGGQPSRKREQIMKGGTCNCGPVQLDLKLFWSTESSCPNPNTSNKEHEAAISGSGDGFKEPLASTCDSQPKGCVGKRNCRMDAQRAFSRCSNEEESGIGSTRKKLRLSKEQSCYLEQSFNDNPTLNPKQKLALAKQLGLQPRQVEVWFQNRRARTKLKQTEVDCEYLKGMCESLKEENRRLRKELQDLRALKSPHEHAPTTKIGVCPSCEQVSSNNISSSSNNNNSSSSKMVGFTTGKPKSWFCQFTKSTPAASRF